MPTQTGQQATESILRLTVDYQDGIKAVGTYMAEIKKLKDEQSELNKAFAKGTIGEKEYGDAMAVNKTTVKQLDTEMKVLTTEIRKKLEADRAEQKQIDLNNASYNELAATYKQMKQRINEMSAAEREQSKAYIQQSKQVYERMKTLQAETGKMQLNVGNYQAAITQAITGNSRFASSLMNLTGGATSASGALGIVNQNAMALGQTLTTLLSNPVFVAIAGIAGAGMAFKFWRDYNEGIAEANRLTKQFTGESGAALNDIRSSIQAIADTFGKDFKETLQGVDTLVAQFGIDWQEAADIVAKGFAAGADINGDFLANLKQYGPVLRDAGLSAQELVAVLQQTRSGVFSKDGLDMISKASKALRDMSNSTAESLRGIGINADELKRKLTDGSIGMMGAIQQVSSHLKDVSENSQEAGAVINDVFGKKGVAAGQAQIKALADLNMELDELTEAEGAYGAELLKSYEIQKELNKVTFALLGTDSWDESVLKVKNYGKAILVYVLSNVYKVYNGMVDLWNFTKMFYNGTIQMIAATAATAVSAWNHLKSLIANTLQNLSNSMKGFGDIITGVFTFDADRIARGWNTVTSSLKGAMQGVVNNMRSFGAQAANNFAIGWDNTMNTTKTAYATLPDISLDDVINDGNKPTSPIGGSPSGGSGNGGNTASSQAAEAERRFIEKVQKQLLKGYDDYTKAQVQAAQKRYELLLATVKKGSEEELELKKKQLAQQEEAELASIDQSVEDAMERAYLMQLVYKKYAQQRAELEAQYLQAQQEALTQSVTNEFTARIQAAADNELEQERIRLEQAQYMRDNARQKEGESIEAFNARKLELEADYQAAQKSLAEKELEVQQVKLEAYESIAGGIAKVFEAMGDSESDFAKISKVLALAEIAINTGKAIAAGVAQAQSVPFPANIAAIATTVATIMANIATAISTVKSAKFAKGGLISGPGTGTSDSITAQVSNGESVMTASATALFSPLLSALNQLGGGVPIVQTGVHAQLGEDMLAAAIAKGYAMAPSPVVSVKEISEVSNRVSVIEDMSRS